jgi:hypothetical protein
MKGSGYGYRNYEQLLWIRVQKDEKFSDLLSLFNVLSFECHFSLHSRAHWVPRPW